VEAIVPRYQARGMDPAVLVFNQTPLLIPPDLLWVIEQVQAATAPAQQAFWIAIVRALFRIEHSGHVDLLLAAIPQCPALEAEFGPAFAVVGLQSLAAERSRAEYARWQELQNPDPEMEQPLEPPLEERIAILLERVEAGE